MKRALIIAVVAVLALAGVGYAAEAAAPTLADVYKTVMEIKADVATLKADGFTKANASGKLASATTEDKLVTFEVTSIMAGPDATVIGFKITNGSKDKFLRLNTLFDTTIAAGDQEVKILETAGTIDEVLPGTVRTGLILAEPIQKDATEVILRTKVYDSKSYKGLMTPTLTISVGK